jgi:hypothetical protein
LNGFFYAEDEYNGFAIVSPHPIEIRYENLGISGLPTSSDISVNNQMVATISFQPAHLGSLFAIVYNGEVRCGVITEEDIIL